MPPSARLSLAAEPVLYHVQPPALGSDTIIVTDYTEVELSSQEESEELMEKEEVLLDQSPAVSAEEAALFTHKPTHGDGPATTTSHNETRNHHNLENQVLTDESNQPHPDDERDGAAAGSDTSAPQEVKASGSDADQKPPQRRGRGRPRKTTETTDQKTAVKTPRRRVKPENSSAEER